MQWLQVLEERRAWGLWVCVMTHLQKQNKQKTVVLTAYPPQNIKVNGTRNGRLGAAGGQQAVLWLCAARGTARERREARLPPAGRGEPGGSVAAAVPQAETSPPCEGSGKLPPKRDCGAAAGSALQLQTPL